MIDPSVSLLLQQLNHCTGQCLIVADENWLQTPWSTLAERAKVISNRFDIATAATESGCDAQFNDFDFSAIPEHSIDHLFYRVSKERPVSHHVINCAALLLKPGGTLYLAGAKNDGIKTYAKSAASLLNGSGRSEKNSSVYLVRIEHCGRHPQQWLDDKQYSTLRPISAHNGIQFYSKPGIFGWNKIDSGSAFLVDYMDRFAASLTTAPKTVLDLGCGYGFISVMAGLHMSCSVTATDNNAGALLATAHNAQLHNIDATVVAADAGDLLSKPFDAILCNPPFHQGFAVQGALTDKFLAATRRLLAHHGKALYVVNSFIPLQRKAGDWFGRVETVADNGQFKLVTLQH